METVFGILNEENVRTLVILVAMACWAIWQNIQFDKKIDKRLAEYDDKMDKRFEGIDKRFEAIDRKFDAIDRKFDAIDRKFEAVDKRFGDIEIKFDKKFEDFEKRQDERFADFEKKQDQRFDWFYQQLKLNDFAHLNNAIESLAFVMKKNNLIDSDDSNFIASKLEKA